MITIPDLQAAIAECQGERNPNANTCIKLAAYYTILNQMEGKPEPTYSENPNYSYAPAPETEAKTLITYDSGSEFSDAIYKQDASRIWSVMDELMEVLHVTQPRLYNGVLNQIRGL